MPTQASTPAPASPPVPRVDALTAQLAAADTQLQEATTLVATRRSEAIAAALAARDFQHCRDCGIVLPGEEDFGRAAAAASQAINRLGHARTTAVHATTARDGLAAQLIQARKVARAADHRAGVLEAHPELAARLDAATAEVERQRAAGREYATRQAEMGLTRAEEAIVHACQQDMGREQAQHRTESALHQAKEALAQGGAAR